MAIERVCGTTRRLNGQWAVLVLLDVRNAFNTASWCAIMQKLVDRGTPSYLINLIGSYLQKREIVVGKDKLPMTAGVPQGSVLGPALWNVLYDDVLRLHHPPGVEVTAYADDLAVTIVAQDIPSLNRAARRGLNKISDWMEEHKLLLAPEKTEAVILKGPRKRDLVDLRILGNRIEIRKDVKYLGVTIDTQGYFGKHVTNTVEKADRRTAALTRLLSNIGGPNYFKRRVYWGVIQSTILYAAPVWSKALRIDRYKRMVTTAQRRILLRITSAYRTVSAEAVQVVAGIPPIDLLVEERARIWGGEGTPPQEPREARNETLRKWQTRWEENNSNAQWTKRLIPRLGQWIRCTHRRTDYFLTQFFSGHCSFKSYTRRIGRDVDDSCRYCGIMDSPEHTLFNCPRWNADRIRHWGELVETLTPENVINIMIAEKTGWNTISNGIRGIMKAKESEERAFQAGNPPLPPND